MSVDVAVIVRTKDRPVLLARALQSIASQTARPRQLVVVNDGGDPALVEAALDAVRETIADEVVVVHHDAPVGRPRGMNVGVEASSTATFVFHDDDDSWDPRFLEATAAHLTSSPDDVGVATRTAVVFERVDGEEIQELSRDIYQSGTTSVTLTDTLYANSTPPICLVYRRSAYDGVEGYDNGLTALADWDFLLRVLRTGTIGFIDGDPLAFWHHRRDDTSASGNSAYADADAHAAFNRSIRDDYLRRSATTDAGLGAALFIADGFRRLDIKADTARAEAARVALERSDAHRAHLDVVHASLSQELASTREAVAQLDEQVQALHRQVQRGLGGRVRTAGSRLVGGIRSGVDRIRHTDPRH